MRPARRTTLQLPHNRLTLDRTFIIVTLNRFSAPDFASGNHLVYGEWAVPLKGRARHNSFVEPRFCDNAEFANTFGSTAPPPVIHPHHAAKPISASIGHAGPVRT